MLAVWSSTKALLELAQSIPLAAIPGTYSSRSRTGAGGAFGVEAVVAALQ